MAHAATACTIWASLRVILVIVIVWPNFAIAEPEFSDSYLSTSDARFLQAALSYSGHYLGRVDGVWGAGSRAALNAATREDLSEAAVLKTLLPLLEDLKSAGWRVFNPERGTSMLIPDRLVDSVTGPDYIEMSTASRDLIVRYIFRASGGAAAMHDWLESEHMGREPFYRANTSEAFISSGHIASGQVYLRSVWRNSIWETVLVQFRPTQAARGRLLIASLANGYLPPLKIEDGGYIDEMLARLTVPPPDSAATPSGKSGDYPAGSGTGFYVNATNIVTADHVIAGCSRLTLVDGSEVTRIAHDPATDLAVLRATRRSGDWLAISNSQQVRLGAPVLAIGFPYAGLFEQGISVTRGNISALRGLDGADDVVMLTAPIQPGNSGGPIVDGNGYVVGVVSYRASDLYTIERSGTVPQNMNAATRLEPLRRFLAKANVLVPAPVTQEIDMTLGVPDAMTRAVVQVICRSPL
ncbi:trypsin-like peptidase domain-containing protein [Jannaschia sp. 2305UL9-9]|uniref:trypsin-like peptidase domain-containing protein n=1 Tax=Jannaschia sp. 2305UL9-9 TaxID=3121638 RepID=UPI0035295AF6